MNRVKGVALGFGLAALLVVGLACGAEERQDPTEAGRASDPPQAQDRPGPSVEPTEGTPPVTGGGTPLASFTYEGVVYHGNSLGRKAATFNEDDVELVGSTTESNKLAPGESLDVYLLKGDTDHVYTFEPGSSFLNEDGRTITIKPEWVRWTAADSNQTAPISLTAECSVTEADPRPLTFVPNEEVTPTGFDGRNGATCRFSLEPARPIWLISLDEQSQGVGLPRLKLSVESSVGNPRAGLPCAGGRRVLIAPSTLRADVRGGGPTTGVMIVVSEDGRPVPRKRANVWIGCGTPINMDDMEVVRHR